MTNGACISEPVGAQVHEALFYGDGDEYVDGVLEFIVPGLEANEAVAIAVPSPNAALLRRRLNGDASRIEFLDMFELGRNPARIIPAVQAMIDRSQWRLHYVGEPIWPGRSTEEIHEATKHEALINLAWPTADIRVLCPYNAAELDERVLADAERTHPYILRDHQVRPSASYHGPAIPPGSDDPLPPPPTGAVTRTFRADDLSDVRGFISGRAAAAGLSRARASDLVLAINELATNTVRHAQVPGQVTFWSLPGRIVCQVEDRGRIGDPLAGRRRPPTPIDGGLGLWMVNQLCDLVELRTGEGGTTVRVHVALD
jgi:anti-sigma regulatory factor (Ser/Thr protein kinase)